MPFKANLHKGHLTFHAAGKHNGLPCTFQLDYQAARSSTNDYTLFMQLSWSQMKPDTHEYFEKSSASWFDLWSRDLTPLPSAKNESLPTRYSELATEALNAETQLDNIPFIQQQILDALRHGATYTTSHKEGGTHIGYRNCHFYRQDYGESNASETFTDEPTFLVFLRRFYDWETSKTLYPDKASDQIAWRLILQLLHR
ncbi:hypothetical protein FEM03_10205 [Phragmitibacter flavus]|uniref:Uncharacterized protein n=1 Tax=Phragmitibacter flavus TaxID=2576071 RepID=A0A5R8KED5_9BACT|nr:hypothetical protein [Phragmitibacter flavus]TLD70678.1 hypothetical protein FEM03_10205 [Phragmitibacter flavus]